jgi:hypothetical protein
MLMGELYFNLPLQIGGVKGKNLLFSKQCEGDVPRKNEMIELEELGLSVRVNEVRWSLPVQGNLWANVYLDDIRVQMDSFIDVLLDDGWEQI